MFVSELLSSRTHLGKLWAAGQLARMGRSSRPRSRRWLGSSKAAGRSRGPAKAPAQRAYKPHMFKTIPKRSVITANISSLARAIRKKAVDRHGLSLAIKGVLVHGLVAIYDRKCTYTLDDANKAMTTIMSQLKEFNNSVTLRDGKGGSKAMQRKGRTPKKGAAAAGGELANPLHELLAKDATLRDYYTAMLGTAAPGLTVGGAEGDGAGEFFVMEARPGWGGLARRTDQITLATGEMGRGSIGLNTGMLIESGGGDDFGPDDFGASLVPHYEGGTDDLSSETEEGGGGASGWYLFEDGPRGGPVLDLAKGGQVMAVARQRRGRRGKDGTRTVPIVDARIRLSSRVIKANLETWSSLEGKWHRRLLSDAVADAPTLAWRTVSYVPDTFAALPDVGVVIPPPPLARLLRNSMALGELPYPRRVGADGGGGSTRPTRGLLFEVAYDGNGSDSDGSGDAWPPPLAAHSGAFGNDDDDDDDDGGPGFGWDDFGIFGGSQASASSLSRVLEPSGTAGLGSVPRRTIHVGLVEAEMWRGRHAEAGAAALAERALVALQHLEPATVRFAVWLGDAGLGEAAGSGLVFADVLQRDGALRRSTAARAFRHLLRLKTDGLVRFESPVSAHASRPCDTLTVLFTAVGARMVECARAVHAS